MVNKFSEKSKIEMLEKHLKSAKKSKAARDPMSEVEAATYKLSDGRFGVPASGIKNAAVSACRFTEGLPMTRAKGSFFVLPTENDLVAITSKGGRKVDERMVSVGTFGNKKKMVRFRPRFDDWSLTFDVLYDANCISPEQLANLFDSAGFSVGLCEFRPERSGSNGMFHVKRS